MFVIQKGFQGFVTDVIFLKRANRKLGFSETIGLLAMLYMFTGFCLFSFCCYQMCISIHRFEGCVFMCIINYTDPQLLETYSVIFKVLFNPYYI